MRILTAESMHRWDAFAREAQSIAALDHPSILTVPDFCHLTQDIPRGDEVLCAGTPYLVTEYADQGSLTPRLAQPMVEALSTEI